MIEIIVALIGGAGLVLTTVISNRKTRKENTSQHANVGDVIATHTATLAVHGQAIQGVRDDVHDMRGVVDKIADRL